MIWRIGSKKSRFFILLFCVLFLSYLAFSFNLEKEMVEIKLESKNEEADFYKITTKLFKDLSTEAINLAKTWKDFSFLLDEEASKRLMMTLKKGELKEEEDPEILRHNEQNQIKVLKI